MTADARTIPFTRSQRSSIRTTGLLMLPIALVTVWSGASELLAVLPIVRLMPAWPFVLKAALAAAMIVLGLGLVVGGVVFLRVAAAGTVGALVRGLRALCLVFAIKAAVLLLALTPLLWLLLGAP